MKFLFYSLITVGLLLAAGACAKSAQTAKTVETNDETILHAWCWSFNSIKDNMKDIADAGYTYVQTSPANTCFVGENGGKQIFGEGKWYYHYQPINWKIGNYQLGTREEFKAMCDEAHKYGVKILVDVLPNHTAFDTTAVEDEMIAAVGGQDMLYHASGLTEIKDYNDRLQCTTGAMGGLPDVNTENPAFQYYYMQYVNDLIACGASGFRYDTAKHIGLPSDPMDEKTIENNWTNDFWDVATGRKAIKDITLANKDSLFIYGEVLQDKNVKEDEYAEYFGMCASEYGHYIRTVITNEKIDSVKSLKNWRHSVTPQRLTTWVESHDTYCNANESAGISDAKIRLGWTIITARQNGIPLFFSRPDGSTRENIWGNNVIGPKGNDEFKHPEVCAVNKFRKAMKGEAEKIATSKDKDLLAISRGDKGVAIINLNKADQELSLSTTLADGEYTDRVYNTKFVVKSGKITGNVKAETSYVIY